MSNGTLKHSRAVAGGRAAASTNKWFHLRRVEHVAQHLGTTIETLECGHTMQPRSDMIGEYEATRRRCRQCPKLTVACEACDGAGSIPNERGVRYRCDACNGDGKFLAEHHDNSFDALGKPVPAAGRKAAYDLLVEEGCDPGEAMVVVPLVAREVEHDNPDRAQSILRGWLPAHGSEVFLFRVLATLLSTPHKIAARR